MKNVLCLACIAAIVTGCTQNNIEHQMIRPIEKAHNIDAWHDTNAMAVTVDVNFGGKKMVDTANFIFETNGPKARMDMKDGTVVIFDGEEAYVSPASADPPGARFHVLTWPWFIVSPYKLRGEAINLSELGHRPLDGRQHRTCKMTFDPGTGDAPDDWYVLYRDLDNKRLVAQAYIVSFGKTKAEANKEPHAVWYQDYRDVNGMPIPMQWSFWNWDAGRGGLVGDPIGSAKLTNVQFVTPAPGTFDVPEDARKLPLPNAG